jgi:hypothetical protein
MTPLSGKKKHVYYIHDIGIGACIHGVPARGSSPQSCIPYMLCIPYMTTCTSMKIHVVIYGIHNTNIHAYMVYLRENLRHSRAPPMKEKCSPIYSHKHRHDDLAIHTIRYASMSWYMYLCMSMCTLVCLRVCISCVRVSRRGPIYCNKYRHNDLTFIRSVMHLCPGIRICVYMCTFSRHCTYMCMCTYVCIYIYIYIYIYTHTHIHTNACTFTHLVSSPRNP